MTTIDSAGRPRFGDDTTFGAETARRQKGEYPGRPSVNQEFALDRALAVLPEAEGVRAVLCGMFAARICSRLPQGERPDPLLVFCAGQLLNCDPAALREPVLAGFAPIVASVREKRYSALALSACTVAVQTVAVADAFVAMITGRSGRAFSPKLAIEELRASGVFSKRLLAALQLSLKRPGGPLCANASRERDVALAA